MNRRLLRTGSALIAIGIAVLFIFFWNEEPRAEFHRQQGKVFGTYYTIQYESTSDLQDSIQAAFAAFDRSLSMFNPHSTLSAINQNRDTVTDAFFESMFTEAERVYRLSDGAFDITVAPLVNLWGFGFQHRSHVTDAQVDSLLPLVGFDKVQLVNHRIVKADPRMMLDAGAVAKGQSCDIIAALLDRNGSSNYLVEIGGEIVSRGHNSRGEHWHVGITKPEEQSEFSNQQAGLQTVVNVSDICMATSGNYRNFYYKDGKKYAHTIDPRTGFPVEHDLLSATVIAPTATEADALATFFMVVGFDEARAWVEAHDDIEACLIRAGGIWQSEGF